MKRTPLYRVHQSLGAKFVEFGGYEMPVQYRSVLEEHHAVRRSIGVFDVSHMGEFELIGEGAQAFLNEMLTNDVSRLVPGRAQYNAMLYEGDATYPDGGIVDDLIVYCISATHFLLIVNASNIEKDWAWLCRHLPPRLSLINRSDEYSLLAVQGPNAEATLQKLTLLSLSEMRYYSFAHGVLAGVPMYVARTGYTGEDGFELCFENQYAEQVWQAVFDAGREFDIMPIGLGARDTLRLEMGYALYGHEITDFTNPIEAGLGWITKLHKPTFKGKAACLYAAEHLSRTLVGFELMGRVIARQGFEIFSPNGEKIGTVCSGTLSPTLNKPIGTGYVLLEHREAGSRIYISIRGQLHDA
ncbi:MAG: glycine cleavage system aminomethyltransferase GcvT [Chloroherpetonaceae bacterium]|nr:glycine cleavage system aminomethyltransferase GcvT [Chloroherpetonaceae bacterium]